MKTTTWTAAGVAALGFLGIAAATDPAPDLPPPQAVPVQPAPADPPPPVPPRVVVPAGPEVIVRQPGNGSGSSSTVIRGSGNGIGNRVVVDNGPGGGTTVVQNSRNGVGNRLVIDGMDIDLGPAGVAPAAPVYRGKATRFWTHKTFSDAYDCNLYWCPKATKWYRYVGEEDVYRALPGQ